MAKVLVVDDIAGVRRMLTHALEDDHSVSQAANGLEALRLAEVEHPDVIIMDLDMPVMDGVEATRRLKADPRLSDIKVLAITGQRQSENSRLVQDSCDAFMEKPFRVAELRELIARLTLKEGKP
jgi:CheY-like chemotaxis protein